METMQAKPLSWITAALAIAAAMVLAVPSAWATHHPQGPCINHGGDTDGDGACNDTDSDDDNDGAPDNGDPKPVTYDELDWIVYKIKDIVSLDLEIAVAE